MSKTGRRAEGVVVGDPASKEPVGAKLDFIYGLFPPRATSVSGTLDEWDYFEGCVLAIGFLNNDRFFVEGSGFVVAPGVAITAAHVITNRLDQLKGEELVLICMGIAADARLVMWNVDTLKIISNSDLCLLGVTLATAIPVSRKIHFVTVTTRTPMVGEQLMVVGFRAAQFEFSADHFNSEFRGDLRVGIGPVTEIYLDGRDKIMLPWPTTEVDCVTLGGMSGGPVFDESGRVVGLLTSSIGSDEDAPGTSHISHLWPALTAEISPTWPGGLHPPSTALFKMGRLCPIEGCDAMSTEGDDTFYKVWGQRAPETT
jgi:S1-C subfamily serine protease